MSGNLMAQNTALNLDENNDEPLLVTLSEFYAFYISETSTLYWTTQTETNIIYWNVYRSISQNFGQSFILNVDEIIEGAGMATEPTNYVYEDRFGVEENATYYYWIESVANNGEAELHGPVSLFIPSEDPGHGVPVTSDDYSLKQNFPNPFNPTTSISFALSKDSNVELIIYNIKGEKIKSIFNDQIYADQINSAIWDGRDTTGKQVSVGCYYYKLITDTKIYYKKMIMMK